MSRAWWRPVAATAGAGPLPVPVPADGGRGFPESPVPFVALVAFLAISLTAPQVFVPALASLRIAMLSAVTAIAVLVANRLVRGRPLAPWTRETRVALGLAAWAIATAPFSYWPGGSLALLTGAYLKTLVVFWLLATLVDTRPRFRVVAWTLTLAAIPLGVTGVQHYLAGDFLLEGAQSGVRRVVGYDAPLTENPNDLALMLNLILPLTLALLLAARRWAVRGLLVAILLVDVAAIVLTFSRAGFLTLATTVALYGARLVRRSGPVWLAVALVLAVAAVPFLPSGYVDRLSTITSVSSDPTGSSQARWRDTLAAASFVLDHPFLGAGIGMNILALNEQRGAAWRAVHNVYLELAVDLGLPGLVLFLVLLVGTIRIVERVRRRARGRPADRDVFHLAEALQTSLVAYAVAAMFHPAAYNFYFYYLAGLAVALDGLTARETRAGGPADGPGSGGGRHA
jgi:probable O-glycosylation ligase (exosortase A-associated)